MVKARLFGPEHVVRMMVLVGIAALSTFGAVDPAVASPQAQGNTTTNTEASEPPASASTETQPPPRLTGPTPQEDTLTAADEAPGSRNVTVSFTENFIADRLPFDVPFNVVGTVEAGVTRLALSVYKVGTDEDLAELINYLQTTVDCEGQRPRGLRVSRSTVSPGSDRRFSLFVNALDPQNYYAFCFVGVTPVPTMEIEADARRILAGTLPGLIKEKDIRISALRTVHGIMSDRIARLGAGRKVPAKAPPGNIFAQSEPNEAFGDLARDLGESFGNLPGQLDNYSQAFQKFITDFGTVRNNATTRKLLTNEIITSFPPATRRLPTPESAVTGNVAFNRSLYVFDNALNLLQAAADAAPANSQEAGDLDLLSRDLSAIADSANLYGDFYESLREASTKFMSFVSLEASAVTVTLGSSVLGADLSRSVYVSLDAGIAYPWRLETMVFYAGTNIYFRPINKAAPLRYKGTFLHRFALTVGITTTVDDKSRRAQDLRATPDDEDTSNSLLLGGGFRVTPSIRVGAGVLVFKETDPNPLINQSSVTATPYVAFTADVDVAQIFRSFF
jgi:hypothetical protein